MTRRNLKICKSLSVCLFVCLCVGVGVCLSVFLSMSLCTSFCLSCQVSILLYWQLIELPFQGWEVQSWMKSLISINICLKSHMHTWMKSLDPSISAKPVMMKISRYGDLSDGQYRENFGMNDNFWGLTKIVCAEIFEDRIKKTFLKEGVSKIIWEYSGKLFRESGWQQLEGSIEKNYLSWRGKFLWGMG